MLLRFDSPIENGTISALTENILVQTALASLTLHPQIVVLLLKGAQLLFSFYVDFLHLKFTVVANYILMLFKQVFTTETRFLNYRKLKNACCLGSLWWYINISHMFSRKKNDFRFA